MRIAKVDFWVVGSRIEIIAGLWLMLAMSLECEVRSSRRGGGLRDVKSAVGIWWVLGVPQHSFVKFIA